MTTRADPGKGRQKTSPPTFDNAHLAISFVVLNQVPGLPQEQAKRPNKLARANTPLFYVSQFQSKQGLFRPCGLTGEMNLPPTIDKNGVRTELAQQMNAAI